jgi:hypothetical protein
MVLRLLFLSREELIEGSIILRHNSLDLGYLGTKEPYRVTSKSEATYIPARSMSTDPSATEGDVRDYENFNSFCDSFRYLGTQITLDLELSFVIDTRIRAALQGLSCHFSTLRSETRPAVQ